MLKQITPYSVEVMLLKGFDSPAVALWLVVPVALCSSIPIEWVSGAEATDSGGVATEGGLRVARHRSQARAMSTMVSPSCSNIT